MEGEGKSALRRWRSWWPRGELWRWRFLWKSNRRGGATEGALQGGGALPLQERLVEVSQAQPLEICREVGTHRGPPPLLRIFRQAPAGGEGAKTVSCCSARRCPFRPCRLQPLRPSISQSPWCSGRKACVRRPRPRPRRPAVAKFCSASAGPADHHPGADPGGAKRVRVFDSADFSDFPSSRDQAPSSHQGSGRVEVMSSAATCCLTFSLSNFERPTFPYSQTFKLGSRRSVT